MDADLKAALLSAYERLLTPLLRILMREGVGYPEFADTAKRAFVQLGREGIDERDRDWPAHVAITIGLSRAEVQRIAFETEATPRHSRLDEIVKVLSAWHTDPAFTGPYGLPLELRLDGNEGADFASLTRTHTPMAEPAQLLHELRRIGAVKETDIGWFKVLTRTYLPRIDVPESFERIGRAVQFLVETVDFNRRQSDPDARLLERTVTADDGLRLDDLPRFRSYVRDRAQHLLEEVDNWLSQLERPQPGEVGVIVGSGVGIYHYVEWPEPDISAAAKEKINSPSNGPLGM